MSPTDEGKFVVQPNVAMTDQTQASALDAIRSTKCFVVVTEDPDGRLCVSATAPLAYLIAARDALSITIVEGIAAALAHVEEAT